MSEVQISNNPSLLQLEVIHHFLTHSYWAEGRSMERIQESIDNSIPFGMYLEGKQIGFARVLSDKVAFAYIMDVFILPEHQGNGYGKALMQSILDHPELREIKKWFLGTRDAHGLYAQFDFENVPPELFMQKPGAGK